MTDSASPAPPLEPLTVAAALTETPLRDAAVAAGHAGLERPIESVGVLDTGELDALRPNQLVLSNAWPLRGRDVRALVVRMVEARCSAFGVKQQGVWTSSPQELIEACDAGGLPLLLLPPGRFEALVNPILDAIAERQAESLRRTAEIHEALTGAAFGNEPMSSIAATVGPLLGVPVAVFDELGILVAAAGDEALWAPEELPERAIALDQPGALEVAGRRYLAAPISTVGRRYGAVVAAAGGGDEEHSLGALAQAAVVCGMQLVGRQRIEAVHRRFERQLLDELAEGSLAAGEAQERARRLGWTSSADYVVLLAARRPAAPGSRLEVGGPAPDAVAEATFVRALAAGELKARAFPRRHGLAVLVHLAGRAEPAAVVEEVRRRLAAARVLWSATELMLGVSRRHRAVADLPVAVHEATCALATSPLLRRGAADVTYFADLGPLRLLATVEDPAALEQMARDVLAPLTLPDDDDLVQTLAALLAHNLHVGEVAAELHFHYNTVRHRLGRLRALFGERLTDPEDRLALSLGIAALRIAALEAGQPRSAARTTGSMRAAPSTRSSRFSQSAQAKRSSASTPVS
ncbi:MAG: PucR family transcriptional regulator ligand-binding domain-containing protein [Actinobacteria bacterium]|nr:PucR family transcriptional regulator ligand-binding domain-containing protein [Actinomycetota bacterium]